MRVKLSNALGGISANKIRVNPGRILSPLSFARRKIAHCCQHIATDVPSRQGVEHFPHARQRRSSRGLERAERRGSHGERMGHEAASSDSPFVRQRNMCL